MPSMQQQGGVAPSATRGDATSRDFAPPPPKFGGFGGAGASSDPFTVPVSPIPRKEGSFRMNGGGQGGSSSSASSSHRRHVPEPNFGLDPGGVPNPFAVPSPRPMPPSARMAAPADVPDFAVPSPRMPRPRSTSAHVHVGHSPAHGRDADTPNVKRQRSERGPSGVFDQPSPSPSSSGFSRPFRDSTNQNPFSSTPQRSGRSSFLHGTPSDMPPQSPFAESKSNANASFQHGSRSFMESQSHSSAASQQQRFRSSADPDGVFKTFTQQRHSPFSVQNDTPRPDVSYTKRTPSRSASRRNRRPGSGRRPAPPKFDLNSSAAARGSNRSSFNPFGGDSPLQSAKPPSPIDIAKTDSFIRGGGASSSAAAAAARVFANPSTPSRHEPPPPGSPFGASSSSGNFAGLPRHVPQRSPFAVPSTPVAASSRDGALPRRIFSAGGKYKNHHRPAPQVCRFYRAYFDLAVCE